MWWYHKRGKKGSRNGPLQAGNNLWDMGNMEQDLSGRNDLRNMVLKDREKEKPKGNFLINLAFMFILYVSVFLRCVLVIILQLLNLTTALDDI